ncbi:putative PLAC8 motif-containing protein [Lupinus albus]|uniref:Putative PLAC8 motif-containing protein n=1 Tax=Lupinus albus TaxID=3870 RepID=A0A6A4NS13_LUPAL|nr:putative PLAC8 motif-containing protein [Lupinus albus]
MKEAPCGDFVTHFCCHLCAICQEYREIHERAGDYELTDMKLAVITAPPIQPMQSDSDSKQFFLKVFGTVALKLLNLGKNRFHDVHNSKQ